MAGIKPIVAVLESWGDVTTALKLAGATVIEVNDRQALSRALDAVDGIVLTGGSDVNPERYGAYRHHQTQTHDTARDKLEFHAVLEARRRRIPLFGICRGHQLLNVAYGGTLHQHIPNLGSHLDNHGFSEHTVKLMPDARMTRGVGSNLIVGTSLHHQAVDRVGDGLMPIGWSRDGLVEALESVPGVKPYALGVQFHPEMDFKIDPSAMSIFEHFVGVAVRRSASRGHYDDRLRVVSDLVSIPSLSYKSGSKYGHYGGEIAKWDSELCSWESISDEQYEAQQRLVETVIEEHGHKPDRWCKFPPCKEPDSCLLYGDCAAEAVAAQRARTQLALPSRSTARQGKRGNGRNHSKGYRNQSRR